MSKNKRIEISLMPSEIYQQKQCKNCLHKWIQKGYKNSKRCPSCGKTMLSVNAKYGWSSIAPGDHKTIPWMRTSAGELDNVSNERMIRNFQRHKSTNRKSCIYVSSRSQEGFCVKRLK